jgi:hypothetical protein
VSREAGMCANGSWFCSTACLEIQIVHDCRATSHDAKAPARVPLGMIMLARGVIGERELRYALASQQVTQERLGVWLVKRGLASDQQVTAALAAQWQCPAVNDVSHPTTTYAAIPMSLLRACRMAPITGDIRSTLHLMFDGVVDHSALYAVQRMLDCPTAPCIGSAGMLEELLSLIATRSREWEVNFGENSPENVARIAVNYADELSSGELRYVSFNGRFWMRIPRESDPVHLVFSGKA